MDAPPGSAGDAMAGQLGQQMSGGSGLMPGIDPGIIQKLMEMQQGGGGQSPFAPMPGPQTPLQGGMGMMPGGDPMRDRIPMEQRLQGRTPPMGEPPRR